LAASHFQSLINGAMIAVITVPGWWLRGALPQAMGMATPVAERAKSLGDLRFVLDAFRNSAFGTITKTYSVSHIGKNASSRYSRAEAIAVSLDVVAGTPEHISTSYVERSHLTLRMSNKRFARLGNGFSKKHHAASVSLYVSHYNFARPHESLRGMTPAMALGHTDHVWSIGELMPRKIARSQRYRPASVGFG
jgi:hypothetical protein